MKVLLESMILLLVWYLQSSEEHIHHVGSVPVCSNSIGSEWRDCMNGTWILETDFSCIQVVHIVASWRVT